MGEQITGSRSFPPREGGTDMCLPPMTPESKPPNAEMGLGLYAVNPKCYLPPILLSLTWPSLTHFSCRLGIV